MLQYRAKIEEIVKACVGAKLTIAMMLDVNVENYIIDAVDPENIKPLINLIRRDLPLADIETFDTLMIAVTLDI